MAGYKSQFQMILVFLSLFSLPSVFPRSFARISPATVFDVSASNRMAKEFLSFNPQYHKTQAEEEEDSIMSGSSTFTLKLYSRDTLHKSPYKNYRDLAISRLKRDSARVNFLYKKLNPKLTPMDLETPVTSGQGTGEYFARLGFGTPAKQLYTEIDTGSDVTWIQCKDCTECYDQIDPIFDPAMSTSYKSLSCKSLQCTQLDLMGCITETDTCLYGVQYGDQSFTKGEFATETLTIGNSAIENVAIGCGLQIQGFNISAGLMGLGRGQVSFPSQINSTAFSYCLVYKDDTKPSTLEFGSPVETSDAVTTPLLSNSEYPSFYYVGLTGISIDDEVIPVPSIDTSGNGGTIVDSGTVVTRFLPEVYTATRGAFVKRAQGLGAPFSTNGTLDTCFDLTGKMNVSIPSVAFHFGATSLTLPSKNIMYPLNVDMNINIYCFSFAESSSLPISIIGNFQQQGIHVSFDEDQSLVGFSLDKC